MKNIIDLGILTMFLSLLIFISCKKDKGNYEVTGTIVDQVTKEPVAGATVFRALRSSGANAPLHGLTSTLSDKDGKFSLIFPEYHYDPQIQPHVYASKSGFAGSDYYPASREQNVGILELYHEAKLKLRLINDTVNTLPEYLNKDDVYVYLSGKSHQDYPGFIGSLLWNMEPTRFWYCSGRKIDTVLVFYPLWGTLEYSVSTSNEAPRVTRINFSTTIIMKPDSVAYLTVWF